MSFLKIETLRSRSLRTDSTLLLEGILVGLLAGGAGVIYRLLITWCEDSVSYLAQLAASDWSRLPLILIAFCIGAIALGAIVRREPYAGGSGIPQVTAEITGRIQTSPLSVLLHKYLGGTIAALCGLSLGREGPSIQLGAMCGKLVAQGLKHNYIRAQNLMSCGAAAGLSVAFSAPVSGVLFSLEEIHKTITKRLIISCFAAAVTADVVSQYVFGLTPIFHFPEIDKMPVSMYPWVVLLGIVSGCMGAVYFWGLRGCYYVYGKLNLYILLRPLPAILCSFVLMLFFPIVLGGGHPILGQLLNAPHALWWLLLLLVVKTGFSLISFASGVPGGIFLPILIQGAILGCLFGQIVAPEYVVLFIVLAMAGYLTAVVRSPLTSLLLLFEMTQRISYFLPLAICCLLAYYTANALGTPPIYEYLLQNILRKEKPRPDFDTTMMQATAVVSEHSPLAGTALRDIALPPHALVTAIDRQGVAVVPRGETEIQAHDQLVFVLPRNQIGALETLLDETTEYEQP